jgi:multicomponent Na+:H+ antiporter subunit D
VSDAVVAPLVVALVAAVVTLGARSYPRLQRGLSLAGAGAYGVAVALLAARVAATGGNRLVYQLSGWPAPFGISLIADGLSVIFLGMSAVVGFVALAFSPGGVDRFGQRLSFHPLYHFLFVGVTGSFLTGDIFNLFVWFEVMLMSSYALVVFYSGPEHTRAGLHYAFLNLVGSAVMLVAIGGLYATVGTLNMADMARRLASPGPAPGGFEVAVPTVLGLSAVLFAVFALKAGVVPFQFWVPDAYRAAPAPVAAVLAAVVKKVGVYAVIRLYFTVFSAAELADPLYGVATFLDFFGPVMLAMAAASVVLGGVGAVACPDLDGLLAYSSIGQVGFIVLPLGVAATAPAPAAGAPVVETVRGLGVVAAVVYAVNHGFAKSALYLASGAVEQATGSTAFEDLGGLAARAPVLAGAFLTAALALVGLPPLSGFFGKLLVFDAAVRGSIPAVAVALGGAVLTIAYFSRAWSRAFWGRPTAGGRFGESTGAAADGGTVSLSRLSPGLVAAAAALALALVVLGVAFDPFLTAAENAARAALDTSGYVDAVLTEVEG